MGSSRAPSKWVVILTLWTGGQWFCLRDGRVSLVGKSSRNDKLPEMVFQPALAELRRLGLLEIRRSGGREEFRSKLAVGEPFNDPNASLRGRIGLAYLSDGRGHSGKEIEAELGYDDSPRLKQDIVDAGYEVLASRDSEEKSRAVYQMRQLKRVREPRVRRANRQEIVRALAGAGVLSKCNRCGSTSSLQPDHRVPVSVAPERSFDSRTVGQVFQFLCNRCNTMKREDCKRCPNINRRSVSMCRACYWHDPKGSVQIVIALSGDLESRLEQFCSARGHLLARVVQDALESYLSR